MKRFVCLTLSLLLLISCVGCGPSEPTPSIPDLVHPNSKGFALIAQNILPLIQEQL